MASLFDRQESLQDRTAELTDLFAALAVENDIGADILLDFKALVAAWEHFCEAGFRQTEQQRQENHQKLKDEELKFIKERAKQKNRRRQLQLREIRLDKQEQELQKSLERFVTLYQNNLTEMEDALQEAKSRRMRKEAEHKKQMLMVDKEIEEVLEGDNKTMPKLQLEGLMHPSACSSVPMSIESPDIVSNRSAFDYIIEQGGDLSHRAVPRPPSQAPPKVKFQHRIKEVESSPRVDTKTSVNHSFNSESQAYDSLMDHLNKHEFIVDESKWESESEMGGTSTSVELRNVLEKAVEFNFDDPEVLAKVKEARKLRDVPHAYNARMKSIVRFLKQKRNEEVPRPNYLLVKKPPTPSKSWRKRLQIQGSGEINPDMAITTPKSEFIFPEDHDFSRTVQSSNPQSSRRQVKDHDSIESFVSDIMVSEDAKNEVNISDILNVKGYEEELGLQTLTRELSPRSDNSAEVSVIRGLKSADLSDSFEVGAPATSEFDGSGALELDQGQVSKILQDLENSKVHKKSGLSDFSGVLNSGSTQSDFNSRF